MGHALCGKDGANIRKVAVDHCVAGDKVADSLNALTEHIVRNAERIVNGCVADNGKQFLVGNDNERVNNIAQIAYALKCISHA